MNRPKDIGTRAETLVARHARLNGFGGADRLTLTGRHDRGDIGFCPGVVGEVKAGRAAETASDALIGLWLAETELERVNAGADIALLITKRAGCGAGKVGQWWTHWWLGDTPQNTRLWPAYLIPIRTTLDAALLILRHRGYGDPIHLREEEPA